MTDEVLGGRFVGYSVADLLGFLAMVGGSGELQVESESLALDIYWVEGRIVTARSRRGGLRIGDMMLSRGGVSAADLDSAARRAKRNGTRIGEAMVDLGLIDAVRLEEVLAEQVFENLYRLFLYEPTGFRFRHAVACPAESALVRVDVQGLLLEGARRCDEWNRLPEVFSDPGAVFEPAPDPESSSRISLSLEEWRLLYLISGKRRLAEIWRGSPFETDLETSRCLYGLASAGLVKAVSTAELSRRPAVPIATKESDSVSLGSDSSFRLGPSAGSARDDSGVGPDEITRAMASVEVLGRHEIDIDCRARLISDDDEGNSRTFEIEADVVTLGRRLDNHLVLSDPHVSSHHARIVRHGSSFEIEDQGSHNGTLVSGRKVRQVSLRGGEVIEIYPYRFRFEAVYEVNRYRKTPVGT